MALTLTDITEALSKVYAVGFADAVKRYTPVADKVKGKELKAWLDFNGIKPEQFRRWEKAGIVRPHRDGETSRSPIIYSKAEILRAMGIKEIAQMQADKLLIE